MWKMKNLMVFIAILCLLGCKSEVISLKKSSYQHGSAVVNYITIDQINKEVLPCYSSNYFFSRIPNINNLGTIVGNIATNIHINGYDICAESAYYLKYNSQSADMITTIESPFENTSINGQIISGISTNNISVGHSMIVDEDSRVVHDLATYNSGINPFSAIQYNYMYHISENGKYATLGTLGGNWAILNTVDASITDDFTDNSNDINTKQAMLTQVNNYGDAVGFIQISEDTDQGLFCQNHQKSCEKVITKPNENTFLETISENGLWSYGFVRNADDELAVFYIKDIAHSPKIPVIVDKLSGFIADGIQNTTDKGLVVVRKNYDDFKTYLYLPSNNSVYSVESIVEQLKIKFAVKDALVDIHVSPNGKYMLLDITETDFSDHVIGSVVYFPYGIEEFLEQEVKPYK